jgi:hypothetical protein
MMSLSCARDSGRVAREIEKRKALVLAWPPQTTPVLANQWAACRCLTGPSTGEDQKITRDATGRSTREGARAASMKAVAAQKGGPVRDRPLRRRIVASSEPRLPAATCSLPAVFWEALGPEERITSVRVKWSPGDVACKGARAQRVKRESSLSLRAPLC